MAQKIKLYDFQKDGLQKTEGRIRCAFFWSMGLGKSFVGSEKLMSYNSTINIVICQKSKVPDWLEHMRTYYDVPVYDLTAKSTSILDFYKLKGRRVGIINYDLLPRRPDLFKLKKIAAIFDESSMIKRINARRTKAALKLDIEKVVLLSGTPTGGQYENLWSQCRLLGWRMSHDAFLDRYVVYRDFMPPHLKWPISIVCGYKNTEEMLSRMRESGALFLKTEDVLELPEQVFTDVSVPQTREYKTFIKDGVVEVEGKEYMATNLLTKMAYARVLCSGLSAAKKQALSDILNSTSERVIVFYNFNKELEAITACADGRPLSIVNGAGRDLSAYEEKPDAIVAVQYQAGAKGLNLQKACHMVLFSPTNIAEDYMQALKRIHRIGQKRTCFYYRLITDDSVETVIYKTLERREDYTYKMFAHDFN